MKFNTDSRSRSTGRVGEVLDDILQPADAAAATAQRMGQRIRQGLAVVLSALMIMIPMGQDAFAQSAPMPGEAQSASDGGQQAPQGQPLSNDQLDQLVAPIALYPDALVAQVLAAATYPTQVVEADRWRQAQGNATAEQIAAGADTHNWDPSVKALTPFPSVLAQMDRNLQWTTDLGNAYYNQPQDVMDSVQAMRHKAQSAGQLRSTPQLAVNSDEGGAITIAPANPTVVYVPVYNPWVVYGSPFPMYPGYYYAPPLGVFFGGLALGFGIGIGIGVFSHWGWGWNRWGMGWHSHSVFYNHTNYMTRSTTVINHGYNRAGGPPRGSGARGAYSRSAGGFNRQGGGFNRASVSNRGAYGANRAGGGAYGANRAGGNSNYARNAGNSARAAGPVNRSAANSSRPSASYGRSNGGSGAGSERMASRGPSPSSGGGRMSGGGGHPSGGGRSSGGGGGHSSGGGHSGGSHEGHGR